jgi:hypothetical protein
MSLYQTIAYTTTGTKESINLDPSIAPFQATVGVNVGTAGNYSVQYSLDPFTVTDANAIWSDTVNIPSGTTSSAITSIISPVSRIRIVIASITGTITLQVSQGFTVN